MWSSYDQWSRDAQTLMMSVVFFALDTLPNRGTQHKGVPKVW